uniref:Putative site-specific DNA endonuclease n=1 Tax=Colemanosphaera charkowiensis TaxID=51706 RepID=A0A6C0RVM4_9CHLO|nr:putative site-specific DNA endonuclease [Colemanosphaera charkowiensis]QIA47076.1 putative site-specific DNA endonuclease [Colemanosphaera charkowiensis]
MTQRLTKETLEQLATERNHVLLSTDFEQEYKSVKSVMKFKCLTCNTEFQCTVHSYKNAKKTGCPTCKKLTASNMHKGKVVSEQTRALIRKKASEHPGSLLGVTGENHPRYKGGYGRDKNQRSNADYIWINAVKKLYNRTCVLTGVKTKLVCHHLEGWNICLERRYDISNGVCITEDVHKKFHNFYGYGNNTEVQFAEFCEKNFNINWYALKERYLTSS